MSQPVKTFIYCLTFTLLVLLATYWLFGFYYEEYEPLFDGMLSGQFSPGTPFTNWYYMGHIGLSYFYSWLYTHLPQVEWMSWILYGYLWLSTSLLLYLFHRASQSKIPLPLLLLADLVLFFLLFADNAIHVQYTRVGYVMCASLLMALAFFFHERGSIAKRPWLFITLVILYLLAALTRLEPAMGIGALSFFFGLAVSNRFWHTVKLYLLPGLVCIGVFSWILIDKAHSNDLYKLVEPDVETQLTARENAVPLSDMKTAEDSLKYEAATQMLWADPHVITVSFLRSLIKKDNPVLVDRTQWQRTYYDLKELAIRYHHFLFFNLIIVLFILFSYRKIPVEARATWLLYNVAFFVLTLLQTYYVKINDRSFLPYLCMFTLGNILLWLWNSRDLSQRKFMVGLVLVGIVLAVQFQFLLYDWRMSRSERDAGRANTLVLQQKVGNNILLLNAMSYRTFFLGYEPFQPYQIPVFDRVYLNEAQVMSLIHPYKEFLDKECSCDVNDFSAFYRYLQHVDKQVYLLSPADRLDLTQRYLWTFHHLKLDVQLVKDVNLQEVHNHEMEGTLDLKLYRLVKANETPQP